MKTGKLAESILKRSVLKQLHKHPEGGASVGADCASFSLPQAQACSWCMQEGVVAGYDACNPGHLVLRCVNNLAASGAEPFAAQIGLMLPEHYEEPQVKALMKEIAEACEQNEIRIIGGDSNISYAVSAPIVTISAVGIAMEGRAGRYNQEERQGGNYTPQAGQRKDYTPQASQRNDCKPVEGKVGQDLVLTKWIGLEGTVLLAKTFRKELLGRYPEYLINQADGFESLLSVLPEARIAMNNGVGLMHDLSQGGVFGALWELAERAGLGLTVDLKKIPIRQETVEICEVCGINPYEMRSSGSLLMAAENGHALVEALTREGIPAVVIGKLTDGKDRSVWNGEEIRFLDRPRGVDTITEVLRERRADCSAVEED